MCHPFITVKTILYYRYKILQYFFLKTFLNKMMIDWDTLITDN